MSKHWKNSNFYKADNVKNGTLNKETYELTKKTPEEIRNLKEVKETELILTIKN